MPKETDALLGQYHRLLKDFHKAGTSVDAMLKYDGQIANALKEEYPPTNEPDRNYKARLSVNPEKLVALAKELAAKQDEMRKAHERLRKFEKEHPEIVRAYRKG